MEAEIARPDGGSPRLLIVDGDSAFRRELRAECEQFGYQVIEAETAGDGLREFEERSPSLVLLDAVLPDGSGLDVCRSIRRADPCKARSSRDRGISRELRPSAGANSSRGRGRGCQERRRTASEAG